jgi:hypothetical protein
MLIDKKYKSATQQKQHSITKADYIKNEHSKNKDLRRIKEIRL